MDLGAYAQIDTLSVIAEANGISVPRLRGYRLMKDEKPVTDDELNEMKSNAVMEEAVRTACENIPSFSIHPRWIAYSSLSREKREWYFLFAEDDLRCSKPIGVRWDRIHGKHRKNLKYVMKRAAAPVERQYALWNRYAGREDVLYIHARIGTGNWSGAHWKNYSAQPWFLEAVDDAYDNTYCDIYAKINK